MATILYAEDDDAMRAFFEKALEKAGHQVISCSDGQKALRALKFSDGAFDLLLTDIMMPEIDGIELAIPLTRFTATRRFRGTGD